MLQSLDTTLIRTRSRLSLAGSAIILVVLLALPACSRQTPLPTSTSVEESGMAASQTSSPAPAPTHYFTLTPTRFLEQAASPTPQITSPSPTPTPPKRFCTPLQEHTLADMGEIITFPYDPPPPGKDTGHHGIDFAYYRRGERLSILGVPVHSVLAGKVAAVIPNRPPYGNMVIVETSISQLPAALVEKLGLSPGESLYLLYAHMNELPLATLEEDVDCGQEIGQVGNTPPEWSSAPHLHLEARLGPSGAVLSPMAFYTTGTSDEERANYTRWRTSGEFRLIDPWFVLEMGFDG